jgi:hypothetical protein
MRLRSSDAVANGFPAVGGIFEVVTATVGTWYYMVRFWDVCHAGMTNEYVMMQLDQCDTLGVVPDAGR